MIFSGRMCRDKNPSTSEFMFLGENEHGSRAFTKISVRSLMMNLMHSGTDDRDHVSLIGMAGSK